MNWEEKEGQRLGVGVLHGGKVRGISDWLHEEFNIPLIEELSQLINS